jgi:hypothetical protein
MQLSEAFAQTEAARAQVISDERELAQVSDLVMQVRARIEEGGPGVNERLTSAIAAEFMPTRDSLAGLLAGLDEPVDQALLTAGANTTGGQLVRMAELAYELVSRHIAERAELLQESEQKLRGILQLIADATDEGE